MGLARSGLCVSKSSFGESLIPTCDSLGHMAKREFDGPVLRSAQSRCVPACEKDDSIPCREGALLKVNAAAVLLCCFVVDAAPVSAQSSVPRGWIEVRIGQATPAEITLTTTYTFQKYSEAASIRTTYLIDTVPVVEGGAGYMLNDLLGIGVSMGGATHRNPASLSATIPSPLFFNRPGTGTTETTDKLTRRELYTNVQAVGLVPLRSERIQLRVLAGPSRISLKGDVTTDVRYTQVASASTNVVTITGFSQKTVSDSAWGFNAGGDVVYLVSRRAGVVGGAKLIYGTVLVEDQNALSDAAVRVSSGGIQLRAGGHLTF